MKNANIQDSNSKAKNGKKYEVFEFKSDLGHIKHIFAKRKIKLSVNGSIYYDLIPINGWGGPIILSVNSEKKWDLVYEFTQAFQNYCNEQNIVSEEVHFESSREAIDFLDVYEVQDIRDGYGIDVTRPIKENYINDLDYLWNTIDLKMEYSILEGTNAMKCFKRFAGLYKGDLKFDLDQYFVLAEEHIKEKGISVEICIKGEVVGMSWFVIQHQSLHCKWTVINSNSYLEEIGNLIKCAIYIWAKEKEIDKIWLTKMNISQEVSFENITTSILHGKKVWNRKVYKQLCEELNIDPRIMYFPAYRIEENN
ncbi:hypothetical protein ACWNS2_07510 [Planococcus plakortidis]